MTEGTDPAPDRARLYDEDTRSALRIGGPAVALVLVGEGLTHLPNGELPFFLATLGSALIVAPLGIAARRAGPTFPVPVRFWPLLPWLLCMAVLAMHVEPFSTVSTTYLMVGVLFGCAALIIDPRSAALACGSLVIALLVWLAIREHGFETRAFALLSMPLAAVLHLSRRRSLLIGERQRDLERQLVRQRDETELVRRMLGISRGLTHHFNNVFSGIVGGTSLALEQLEPEHPAREATALALASGEQGSEIIERLGLTEERLREAADPVALEALLEDPELAALVPPNCRLDVNVREDLPPLRLQRERFLRALRELLANAVEAIGPESGVIRVELGPDERPDRIRLDVIDTGTGMGEEALLRCFEPFWTTREPNRRGLGLPYVLGVVERHAGTIHIDSRPGRGTRVRLRLPVGGA